MVFSFCVDPRLPIVLILAHSEESPDFVTPSFPTSSA
jgi:hypothetical protein